MKMRTAQILLFLLLLVALVLATGALAKGYNDRQFFTDDFHKLVLIVLGHFTGPLSVLIGSLFAVPNAAKQHRATTQIFWLAFGSVFLWCLLTTGRTIFFIRSNSELVEDLETWYRDVVTAGTFLVSGTLSYFFISEGVQIAAPEVSSSEKKGNSRLG